MKMWVFLLISSVMMLLFIDIPPYVELNHLRIIDKINVLCLDNNYQLTLYEKYPKRVNNTIKYTTKKYINNGNNLLTIKNELESKTNDKYYYKSIKKVETNCQNYKDILKIFSLKKE